MQIKLKVKIKLNKHKICGSFFAQSISKKSEFALTQ